MKILFKQVATIIVACGHLQPHIEHYDNRSTYRQLNILYENKGAGHYTSISEHAGTGL
ncbi:MAG: hypothetical protein IIC50_00255 [Planctomycetes bacterium]|nr:hypothetical protein [Planctomycetota bacterium]